MVQGEGKSLFFLFPPVIFSLEKPSSWEKWMGVWTFCQAGIKAAGMFLLPYLEKTEGEEGVDLLFDKPILIANFWNGNRVV